MTIRLGRPTSAGTSTRLSNGGRLNDPLGLTLAVNEDILAANDNDGLAVTEPNSLQSATILLDPAGAGVPFGVTAVPRQGVYVMDDGTKILDLLP